MLRTNSLSMVNPPFHLNQIRQLEIAVVSFTKQRYKKSALVRAPVYFKISLILLDA